MSRCDKENGLILLCVLVFMQLFALIGLYLWQNILLSQKSSQQALQRNELFHKVNLYLLSLEQSLLLGKSINAPCLINEAEVIDFTKGSESWWQANACQASNEGIHYAYVIENLETSLCTVFYRITLRGNSDKMPNAMWLLQATIAKGTCHQPGHFRTEGQQAWRLLN